MRNIKTSVIVPVYNTSRYLRECFESIFHQTQTEIEVIVINDGSTDDSLSILEEIKDKYPEMVIYSQENQGLGAARNKGIELAKGEYIYFIDSDDCLVKNTLEVCYSYAQINNLDILMFDACSFGDLSYDEGIYDRSEIIKEQEIVMNGKEYFLRYGGKAFLTSACLIYTSARFLKENHLKFLHGVYYEDDEFFYKMIPLAKNIMYIPRILYKRRYRENSIITSEFDSRHAKDSLKLVQAIKKQKHDKDVADVIQKIAFKELDVLLDKCEKYNLLTEQHFVEDFFTTAETVYGCNIEKINGYSKIHVLYQLSNACNMVPDEKRKRIKVRRNEIIDNIRKEVPLILSDKEIGIYGTGKRTEQFLNEYEKNIGEIRAKVIFIESNVKSKVKKYRNKDIFNIKDIGHLNLECIVITSAMYKDDMYQAIYENYGNRFKVVCVDVLFYC